MYNASGYAIMHLVKRIVKAIGFLNSTKKLPFLPSTLTFSHFPRLHIRHIASARSSGQFTFSSSVHQVDGEPDTHPFKKYFPAFSRYFYHQI